MNSMILLVTPVIKIDDFGSKQTFWESLNLLLVVPTVLRSSSSSSLSEPISQSSQLELDLPTTALNFRSFSLLDFSDSTKSSPIPFRPSNHNHRIYIYINIEQKQNPRKKGDDNKRRALSATISYQ